MSSAKQPTVPEPSLAWLNSINLIDQLFVMLFCKYFSNRILLFSLIALGFFTMLSSQASQPSNRHQSSDHQSSHHHSQKIEETKKALLEHRFRALDRDHDGFIDQREMSGDRLLMRVAKHWDSNADGLISKSEFIAYLKKVYLNYHSS